jgi:hypothetical protein
MGSGDRAVVSGRGIKISDTTYVVYGFPLLRQVSSRNLNDVMRIVGQIDVMSQLRRRKVIATSWRTWRVEFLN